MFSFRRIFSYSNVFLLTTFSLFECLHFDEYFRNRLSSFRRAMKILIRKTSFDLEYTLENFSLPRNNHMYGKHWWDSFDVQIKLNILFDGSGDFIFSSSYYPLIQEGLLILLLDSFGWWRVVRFILVHIKYNKSNRESWSYIWSPSHGKRWHSNSGFWEICTVHIVRSEQLFF